jgi:hypothetical protein
MNLDNMDEIANTNKPYKAKYMFVIFKQINVIGHV